MKKLFRLIFSFIFILAAVFGRAEMVYSQTTATRLGGMNLDGYCRNMGQGGSALNGTTWTCESGTPITMNAACQWQYVNQNATARQETANNPYSWACFNGAVTGTPVPTPTPTRAVTPTPTPTRAVTPVPSPTQAPTNSFTTTVIFSDSLAAGWVDASYNTTNAMVTTPVGAGTTAISSRINQDGGFDLQSVNGIQTSSTTILHFMLRASGTNQRYEVYADTQYGQPLRDPVSLTNYGGQPTSTGWTTYDIPVTDLNAGNVLLRNIAIHDAAGANQAALFIDQVELRTPSTSVSPTPTPRPTSTVTPTPNATIMPTPTPTATPTPPVGGTALIFEDNLATGWTDASYNATNTVVTTPVASGTNAISTRINQDGGFDLQSINGVLTTSTSTLHMLLRASGTNQRYEVYADTQYGQPLRAPVSLANYAGQPTSTGWTTYDIPLSDLGATNVSVRDIVIHDAANANQAALYVDRVELRSVNMATTPTTTPAPTITVTPNPTVTPTQVQTLEVRKSIYALSPAELTRLANAMNTIRRNGVYQDFMNRHMQSMMTLTQPNDPTTMRNVAHRGPAFLPWHREFLNEFEKALQTADPSVTLPYWPLEQDAAAANAGQLPRVFTAAYFGGDGNPAQGNRVTDGPFASWGIVRMVGRDPEGLPTLPTQADVNALMQYTNYDSAPYNETSSGFRNAIEGWIGTNGQWSMHNRIHAYVGGDMLPRDAGTMTNNVANDPVFWLVHADIDRIWWQWQQQHGTNNYQPMMGGPTGHNLNDVMQFLNGTTTPADTLSTQQMNYTYQ